MLDFDAAKHVARDRWLSAFDDEPGGPQVIRDSECVEYEWGWLIASGPSRAELVPPEKRRRGRRSILVDRVTGQTETVTTAGPRIAIIKLLERRPAESRSPDVSVDYHGNLAQVRVSMRAFTPLSESDAAVPDEEAVEVYRLTDRDE